MLTCRGIAFVDTALANQAYEDTSLPDRPAADHFRPRWSPA
jgi:hypothetical protein